MCGCGCVDLLFRFLRWWTTELDANPDKDLDEEGAKDDGHTSDLPNVEGDAEDEDVGEQLPDWLQKLEWLQARGLLVLKSLETQHHGRNVSQTIARQDRPVGRLVPLPGLRGAARGVHEDGGAWGAADEHPGGHSHVVEITSGPLYDVSAGHGENDEEEDDVRHDAIRVFT